MRWLGERSRVSLEGSEVKIIRSSTVRVQPLQELNSSQIQAQHEQPDSHTVEMQYWTLRTSLASRRLPFSLHQCRSSHPSRAVSTHTFDLRARRITLTSKKRSSMDSVEMQLVYKVVSLHTRLISALKILACYNSYSCSRRVCSGYSLESVSVARTKLHKTAFTR